MAAPAGYSAPPDAEAIGQAVRAAAALDPLALAAIGEAARESVAERFEPGTYLAALEDLYDRLRSRRA